MNFLETLFTWLPLLGPVAVVAIALTKVRERNEQAAFVMALGAGGDVAFSLIRHFVKLELLWMVGPIVHVAAVGAVVFGLMQLIDALNPKQARALPPMISALPKHAPNYFIRGFFGVFAACACLTGISYAPLPSFAGVVAVAAALAGSVWLDRRGGLSTWLLERRPDLILWAYVFQLRVVNRQTGSSTVHWSAQLGLASGSKIALPAGGEDSARALVGSVMELKPNLILGFSPENQTKFQAMVKAANT